MKILELPAYFLPHTGGIESIVYSLSKEWAVLGHSVKVITSSIGSDVRHEVMNGVKVKRVPAFNFMQDAIAPKLYFKLERADVAHIHHPHPFWIYVCSLYCRVHHVPYVFHMHGREIIYKDWKNLFARIYNYFFLDSVLRHASRIMTHTMKVVPLSKYMQKYQRKIVYIPHGVDTPKYKALSKRENFIFTVGVRDYKRLDLLIRAMPLVLKSVNTSLLIAGDGTERPKLMELTKRLGLSDKVKFLGYISEKEKYELYAKAGVFVLPSPTIMESFGTVAFEAFSMKCPVIVTSGAGISEVFAKENIGIIVKPYDITEMAGHIVNVLKNKKLAKSVGERGYSVIMRTYKWEDIAKQYLKVFEAI
jgi:glycosyltransferase involved in cell wall biosynthesis